MIDALKEWIAAIPDFYYRAIDRSMMGFYRLIVTNEFNEAKTV